MPPDETLIAATPDRSLLARQAALDAAVQPLPGSQPYENCRPVRVPQRFDRQTAIDFLTQFFPHIPPERWQAEFHGGRLTYQGAPIAPDRMLRSGMTLIHTMPNTVEPEVDGRVRLLFEDDDLIVLEKPAPLPMHPSGRYNRNTLIKIVNCAYSDQSIRMVHRLDANTTGCVVLARNLAAAQHLARQFANGGVEKNYLARIHGHPAEPTWVIDQPIPDIPAVAGIRLPNRNGGGKPSRTRVVVLQRFDDQSTLVECTPLTGRTNQIRLHLWNEGHPILGDPSYLPHRKIGDRQTLHVGDPPLCLHAQQITFQHPTTNQRIQFQASCPGWGGGNSRSRLQID